MLSARCLARVDARWAIRQETWPAVGTAWTIAVASTETRSRARGPLADLDDQALVAACLGGRSEAFDVIVERHQRAVYQLCYRFVGSHEDAADLTQEVFLRAYRGDRRFRGELVALDVAVSHRRQRVPEPRLGAKTAGVATRRSRRAAAAPAEDPAAALIRADQAARVRAAVARLPERSGDGRFCASTRSCRTREIAAALGTSVGAVKANFFHALGQPEEGRWAREMRISMSHLSAGSNWSMSLDGDSCRHCDRRTLASCEACRGERVTCGGLPTSARTPRSRNRRRSSGITFPPACRRRSGREPAPSQRGLILAGPGAWRPSPRRRSSSSPWSPDCCHGRTSPHAPAVSTGSGSAPVLEAAGSGADALMGPTDDPSWTLVSELSARSAADAGGEHARSTRAGFGRPGRDAVVGPGAARTGAPVEG